MSFIYLDYNATAPLCEAAADAISTAAVTIWGNPSSLHADGQAARTAVERARGQVAGLIGATAPEIVFTSGATEAINWVHRLPAVKGAVVTSPVEHPAVVGACERALHDGQISEWIQVVIDDSGRVDLEQCRRLLDERSDIALVSIMLSRNRLAET